MKESEKLSLNLAVVTHGREGLQRVSKMLLEPIEGISYVVSWQNHEDATVPEEIKTREDVSVWRTDLKGISNNRNNAIDHCYGDIVLFADDDVIYTKEGLLDLIEIFQQDPDTDLGLFKIDFGNRKIYPSVKTNVRIPFPKGYYVSSIEIAFRKDRIKDLRCWPELGLGAQKMKGGEDEFFVISALKRGLHCNFYPIEIGSHPWESTGSKPSPDIIRAMGFIISVEYPATLGVRLPLKAYRLSKNSDISFYKSLKCLIDGLIIKKRMLKRIPLQYSW